MITADYLQISEWWLLLILFCEKSRLVKRNNSLYQEMNGKKKAQRQLETFLKTRCGTYFREKRRNMDWKFIRTWLKVNHFCELLFSILMSFKDWQFIHPNTFRIIFCGIFFLPQLRRAWKCPMNESLCDDENDIKMFCTQVRRLQKDGSNETCRKMRQAEMGSLLDVISCPKLIEMAKDACMLMDSSWCIFVLALRKASLFPT